MALNATNTAPQPYPTPRGFTAPSPNVPIVGFKGQAAPTIADISAHLRNLMGPLGQAFPTAGFKTADVPWIEAGLNFQIAQQAEADRQRGYEELTRGRAAIGTSPESELAREIAKNRATENRFSKEIDQMRQAMLGSGAQAAQQGREAMMADLARRGIGGGTAATQMAQLEQDALINALAKQATFELQAAQMQEEADRQAYQDLAALATQQEAERMAFDEALAKVFLETERAPVDLSGLIAYPPGGNLPAGHYGGYYL